MDVSLADSGFVIKRYDGLEAFEGTSEDDENQPDRYLSGNGSASLAMSWSAMGVDTEEAKSDTYELQGVFNFPHALDSEKALFTTRATKLLAEPDGSLKIMLADGSEYTSTTSPLVKDGKKLFSIISEWILWCYLLRRLITKTVLIPLMPIQAQPWMEKKFPLPKQRILLGT